MTTITSTDEILVDIRAQLGGMNNRLDTLTTDLGLVKSVVIGLEKRMETVETRMETMNGHLSGLRRDMADLATLVRERSIPAKGP